MLCLFAAVVAGSAAAAAASDYPVVYTQVPESTSSPFIDKQLYDLSLYGGYGIAASSGPYACDVLDVELQMARHLSPHHALTLSLSYAWARKEVDKHSKVYTDNYNRDAAAIMLGYRFTQRVGKHVQFSLGAKAGPDLSVLNVDYGRPTAEGDNHQSVPLVGWDFGKTHSQIGLGYAAYAEMGLRLGEDAELRLGYMFRGTTCAPDAEPGPAANPGRLHTDPLRWHEVRAGVSWRF